MPKTFCLLFFSNLNSVWLKKERDCIFQLHSEQVKKKSDSVSVSYQSGRQIFFIYIFDIPPLPGCVFIIRCDGLQGMAA